MEKALKLRLITGLIAAPIAIALIVLLPTPWFAVVLGMFFFAGAWEWAGLVSTVSAPRPVVKISYTALCLALMIAGWFALAASPVFITAIVGIAIVWWLLVLLSVLTYPKSVFLWSTSFSKALAGVFILIPAWLAMVSLHGTEPKGSYYALYVFMMVWLADSAAYFAGKTWGKHKLAPQLSPGKSWEGVIGAVVAVFIYGVIASYFMGIYEFGFNIAMIYLGISLLTVVVSVLGDLAESMFKRQAHIKDSGSFFPGHGGVLDRFDSLTAAAPVFLLCFWWFSDLHKIG